MLEEKGIRTVLFDGLDSTEQLEDIGSRFDGKECFLPSKLNGRTGREGG